MVQMLIPKDVSCISQDGNALMHSARQFQKSGSINTKVRMKSDASHGNPDLNIIEPSFWSSGVQIAKKISTSFAEWRGGFSAWRTVWCIAIYSSELVWQRSK